MGLESIATQMDFKWYGFQFWPALWQAVWSVSGLVIIYECLQLKIIKQLAEAIGWLETLDSE